MAPKAYVHSLASNIYVMVFAAWCVHRFVCQEHRWPCCTVFKQAALEFVELDELKLDLDMMWRVRFCRIESSRRGVLSFDPTVVAILPWAKDDASGWWQFWPPRRAASSKSAQPSGSAASADPVPAPAAFAGPGAVPADAWMDEDLNDAEMNEEPEDHNEVNEMDVLLDQAMDMLANKFERAAPADGGEEARGSADPAPLAEPEADALSGAQASGPVADVMVALGIPPPAPPPPEPAPAKRQRGDRAAKGSHDAAISTIAGEIVHYSSNNDFAAICCNPKHGPRCILTRKGFVPGRKRQPGGSPCGFLLAWLMAGLHCESRDEHWAFTDLPLMFEERKECRRRIKEFVGGRQLLTFEKPKDTEAQDSEPEDMGPYLKS